MGIGWEFNQKYPKLDCASNHTNKITSCKSKWNVVKAEWLISSSYDLWLPMNLCLTNFKDGAIPFSPNFYRQLWLPLFTNTFLQIHYVYGDAWRYCTSRMLACYLVLLYSLVWSDQQKLSDSKIFDFIKDSVRLIDKSIFLKDQNVQISKIM